MSLVIDSSMTLAWCFEDKKTEETTAIFNRVVETGVIVPDLWRLEVMSGQRAAIRRKRITIAYRDASLHDLRALAIAVDFGTNDHAWPQTLELADRYGLSPCDAAYSEFALRKNLPLATLDEELLDARKAAGAATK